jgi:hypothetical protein
MTAVFVVKGVNTYEGIFGQICHDRSSIFAHGMAFFYLWIA